MGFSERCVLYRRLEALRNRPLIVYVTSARRQAGAKMAGDVISEFMTQLEALPPGTKSLDLMLVSEGGDPTVAWRIVSLIRERVSEFAVLVPQAAFSAATLIALGADEIVMHQNGNLGPVDPQITVPPRSANEAAQTFGSEDVLAFLQFCRERVGLSDQTVMLEVFKLLASGVGAVSIGVAARGSQLSVTMGEKLLRLHMSDATQSQEARAIAEKLNKQFFHHGYPVSRTEAKEIGLKIADTTRELEDLLWQVWLDIEGELEARTPFNPLEVLQKDPNCAALFAPVPQVNIPTNLPPAVLQQAMNQILQQLGVVDVGPTQYNLVQALMESARTAAQYVTDGLIFACRQPDLQIKMSLVQVTQGWRDRPIPSPASAPAPAAEQGGSDVQPGH